MKFRDLVQLNEGPIYSKKVAMLMSLGAIPLNDRVTKILGGGKEVVAYHATDLKGLENLSKIGKTKKQISAFTYGLGKLVNKISTQPDVVAKIKGYASIEFDFDIFSDPDSGGLRWVKINRCKKFKFLYDALNTKTIDLLREYSKTSLSTEQILKASYLDDKLYLELFNKLTGKQKFEIVKLYYDNLYRLLKNEMYVNIIKECINKPKEKYENYNEIIMSRFKVIEVYAIENAKYKYDHSSAKRDIEKLGYKYGGFLSINQFPSLDIKN